jgi:hypothetical protein
MRLYFAAHTTACLTKQGLKELIQTLLTASEVRVIRCVASQIGGRLLTEAEAADQRTLEKFFASRRVNCEWIMPIDLVTRDGKVHEV